ncbi:hypothetical protein PE36_06177 [Moritella sp. PE36]|uniref:O-antigen ligase family protein n=1 Tax=Moritella sp. PE36 TaxID=58051 RepID=UPI00015681C4|nr:O-antigen ligase family protein [Moritella sp. PE36]EDM69050.1 hypothetical protein PE36_06177 [Moritella sp. PE36]
MTLNNYLNKGSPNRLFLFILFGFTLLPMVPIWTSCIFFLSLMIVNQNFCIFSRVNSHLKVVNATQVILLLFVLINTLYVFFVHPKQLAFAFFNINGISFELIPSVVLVTILLIQFILLVSIVIKLADRKFKFFISGFILFTFILVSKLLFGSMISDDVYIDIFDGVSRWLVYLNLFLCCLIILLRGFGDHFILKVITLSVLTQSIIICAQHFFGDYSYIKESVNYSEYFYRVKGTYFYHASASMFIGLGFFITLYNFRSISNVYGWLIPVVVLLALYLNSTRAISLAMTCSSFLAFFLIMFDGIKHKDEKFKFKFEVVVLLISMLVFSLSIFYEKNNQGAVKTEAVGIEEMAESNSARMELLSSIVSGLDDNVFLGQGMGGVKVELNGNNLGGELETYSSHSIFVDVFLATGILGGSLFLFFYLAPLFILFILVCRRRFFNIKSVYLLSTLTYFFITGFFFPQERNMTIMFSMILVLITMYDLYHNEKKWR